VVRSLRRSLLERERLYPLGIPSPLLVGHLLSILAMIRSAERAAHSLALGVSHADKVTVSPSGV